MRVRLNYKEQWEWVQQNCTRYSVTEWVIDVGTLERRPYKITLFEEQDQVLYTLRWS